jgi:hypothetical protein
MQRRLTTPGRLALLIAAISIIAGVSGAGAAQRGGRGPWLLTAVPGMGALSWRCNAGGLPALALDATSATATETLTFRAGGKTLVQKVMQPGRRLDLPYVRFPRQHVTLVQSTEPGTLTAVVAVDFSPRPISRSHCVAYLPPGLVVHVYAR